MRLMENDIQLPDDCIPPALPERLDVADLARAAFRQIAQDRIVPAGRAPAPLGRHFISAFCTLLVRENLAACLDVISGLQARGADYVHIVDDLMAAAARQLGRNWDQNDMSFAQVCAGISTLLALNASVRRSSVDRLPDPDHHILFATRPCQAHTLGITLAAEAFRQQGWDAEMMLHAEPGEILDRATHIEARLFGLTAGRAINLDPLIRLAGQLADLPHRPHVLIGGIAAPGQLAGNLHPRCLTTDSVEHALATAEALCTAPRMFLHA